MKKAKKLIAGIALSAMLLTGCDALANRDYGPNVQPGADGNDIQDVYMAYRAAGGTLTYEQWLESVRGPQGIQGEKGDKGDKGDQGIQGEKGDKGDKGDQGTQGEKGDKGDQGTQGEKGDKGDKGDQGIQGEKGDKGDQGIQGEKGQDGNSFLNGYGRPADTKGKDGDTYLDFNTLDMYSKENGHWVKQTNMREDLRWDATTEAKMLKYFGEALPYADFDASNIEYEFDFMLYSDMLGSQYASYDTEYFYINCDSDFDVFGSYGEKLESFGYTYNSTYDQYTKRTASNKVIWVEFNHVEDETDGNSNYIMIEMPVVRDGEYYKYKEFDQIDAWPADNIATTMGDDFAAAFTGVDFEGELYEYFDIANEEDYYDAYYYDRLAIEGDFSDALIAQVLAAGFTYNSQYKAYFDANQDREVVISFVDGFTAVNLYGAYAHDYDENYFLENDFEAVTGFPSDLIELAFYPENRISGANNEGTWYVSYDYNPNYQGYEYFEGYIVTLGDYADALIAQLLAAGFEYEDNYDDYCVMSYAYCEVTVEFGRGATIMYIAAAKTPRATLAEAKEALEDFFYAEANAEVELPLYAAADASVFCQLADYAEAHGVYLVDIFNTTAAEMDAYADALEAAGWTVTVEDADEETPEIEVTYVCSLGDFGVIPYIEIQNYLDDPDEPCVELVCYGGLAHNTAAQASQTLEQFYSDEYGMDIDIPDYEAANPDAYFGLIDSYVEQYGVYLVNINGSNLDELNAYFSTLEIAGWTISEEQEEDEDTGEITNYWKAVFGTSGECPTIYVYNYLEDDGSGYIRFECYTSFVVEAITPESAIAYICSKTGRDVEEVQTGVFGTMGGYDPTKVSIEDLENWCENLFLLDGFESLDDGEWVEDEEDGSFSQSFYNEEADVIVEFYVYYSEEYEANIFEAYAYYGGAND